MPKTPTSADAPAAPSRCYVYWRAPSGFWTRRVAVEKPDRPWCAGIDGVRRKEARADAAPPAQAPRRTNGGGAHGVAPA